VHRASNLTPGDIEGRFAQGWYDTELFAREQAAYARSVLKWVFDNRWLHYL
jgi:hypothetical protein